LAKKEYFNYSKIILLGFAMSYHANFHHKITSHHEDRTVVPVTDAHLHFVDFIQESDGIQSLLKVMDVANVQKAVVFGLPVKKKWEAFEKKPPHYYLDDNSRCYYFHQTDEILAREYLSLTSREQKRLAPLICGFNPTDKYAVRDVERMLEKYPFWRGIGELLCRHDDLTNLTNEETARINHPALFEVYELCADKNLPVLIHQNSTSVSIHDEYEHLYELEEVLQEFPRTTFVWAHCGISRRVFHKNYHEMVVSLFDKFANLYVDISWVIYDDVICLNLEPKKHWLDAILNYSDRFCIGSDLCGHFEHLGKTMARYNNLLRRLEPRAQKMIASENAEKLWFS
jgi:predicted TIM-barrel fold metal-dependent hydrolase